MNRMKTLALFACIVCLSAFAVCVESTNTSGKCGNNLFWEYFVKTKTLNISGEGYMSSYIDPESVPWYPFRDSIKKIVFDGNVQSLAPFAFYKFTILPEIILPETLSLIGDKAFHYCESLTTITIPSSVTQMSNTENTFVGCKKLLSIHVDKKNQDYKDIDGVLFDFEVHSLFTYPPGRRGGYEIPSSVKEIENSAFERCQYLTSVVISEGVTSIGHYAFQHCNGLTKITLPSTVDFVGTRSIGDCSNLVSIEVHKDNPKFGSVDGVLFKTDASSLIQYPSGKRAERYVIPDGTTRITGFAFYVVPALTSIIIPASVDGINTAAFFNCSNLEIVSYLGNTDITGLSGVVFRYCDKMHGICVPLDYQSPSFCFMDIICKKESCVDIHDIENHCYSATCHNNSWQVYERDNVTSWEMSSNDCVRYFCNNDTGVVSEPLCKPTSTGMAVCKDNKCLREEPKPEKPWIVNITIDNKDVEVLNTTAIRESIFKLIGKFVEVEVVMDDNGHIVNVVAFMDDKESASELADKVNNMDKGDSCPYGVLCRSESARAMDQSASVFLKPGVITLCMVFYLWFLVL